MIKTYISKTSLSINILVGEGKSMHICFDPLSNGSSTYTTGDEVIQRGIEHHYNFGRLFRLLSVSSDEEVKEEEPVVEESKLEDNVMSFSDWNSAKDYLAERYGVSRTSMRSQKSIEDHALSYGIKIVID